MLDDSNRNLPELNARSVDANNSSTSGSEGQATRGSHSTKPEPKRKKRKLLALTTQTNDMSIQCEPFIVHEACQTDHAESLPRRFLSFSDVCHVVQHDHNYACIGNTVLGKKSVRLTEDSKAKRALHFMAKESADHHEKLYVKEEFESKWLYSDMSDSEESEISGSESDFNIQNEESDGDDSEWDDDLVMKREDPEEMKKEHKFVSPKGGGGWVVKPQYEEK